MSKEMEPQGIIFQLEWKKKTGHSSRDEVASIGIWDTMDNSLDWTTFRSYLCQNLGTMEDISVAYVDSEGDELPIESECEFQEALKYARHRARKGREIVLKLDGQGVPLSQASGKASGKVREPKLKHAHKLTSKSGSKSSSVEKIRNSIVQASLIRPIIPMHRFTSGGSDDKKVKVKKHSSATAEDDDAGKLKKAMLEELTARQELMLRKLRSEWDDSPPQWFKKYMQKVKSEIIAEVTTNVLFANKQVVELVERRMQDCGVVQATTKKPRKKKKNGSDEDSDVPQDSDLGSSKLLKKLEKLHKQEKKLDSKLEKLETKTKRRMEKKSLQQPLERKVSSAVRKKSSSSGAGPYLMDAIVLYDGQQVADARALVGSAFTKVWEIMNNGTLPWTDKTELRLTWGTPGLEPEETAICCPILNPGEKGQISINFKPPDVTGTFETYWHFYHMGKRFGHWLCCAVVVDGRDTAEKNHENDDEAVIEEPCASAVPVTTVETQAAPITQMQDREAGDYSVIYDDNSDSLTFMSDISTDVPSEDDDNFVVVPMPACFKCDVPLGTVAEGSEAPVSDERNESDLDTTFVLETLGNGPHQQNAENSGSVNDNADNENECERLEKVIMVLSEFSVNSSDCNKLEKTNDIASNLDGRKETYNDEKPSFHYSKSANDESSPRSSMGDGVYVVDGSGRCTLLKKDFKHPGSPRSVFIFGSNGRLQKRTGDSLLSSGKSKVSGDKKVYVVNEDGSCSLLEDDNPSTSQPASGADVSDVTTKTHRVVQYSHGGVTQYFKDGNNIKSVFTSGNSTGDNIPQNSAESKSTDGVWKTFSRSSNTLPTSTGSGGNTEPSYSTSFYSTGCFPNYTTAAYNIDVGIGTSCNVATGFTSNCNGATTTRDNGTVFSTAGVGATAGFNATNNLTENGAHISSTEATYQHNCPLVRSYNSAEVGMAPAINAGACFTIPDIGVGFSPISNCDTGLTVPGVAPVTFATAANTTPAFSATGVTTAAVGNQRPGLIPSGTGEAYILDPKLMTLPTTTSVIPISPGETRAVEYYLSPSGYYEPMVFDDRFFTAPQAMRYGVQPANPDGNPIPVANPENYFEPVFCGPSTQPTNVENGTTATIGKQGSSTVDATIDGQCRFDPTVAGCRPHIGHIAAYPPPPPPPQPAFGFVPTYRPYSAAQPSAMPVGTTARVAETAPVQPVRLFPPGLLPSTISSASSVLSGVSSVLRNLYPWGRQDYLAAFQNSPATATHLMHLQEMGFVDHERNTALLHQYDNDLNRVVTELLTLRETNDSSEQHQTSNIRPS